MKNFSSKNSAKMTWKLVPGPFVFVKNWNNYYWKQAQPLLENTILQTSWLIGYVTAKLSKCMKISMQNSSDSLFHKISGHRPSKNKNKKKRKWKRKKDPHYPAYLFFFCKYKIHNMPWSWYYDRSYKLTYFLSFPTCLR